MKTLNATAHKLLDAAQERTQKQGFNAFSYKDLQNEVGVKTSSIHYYFPTKHDLALAMTQRYIDRFSEVLVNIERQHASPLNRLEALGEVYMSEVNGGKFCLCGMLASDMFSLPDVASKQLHVFFDLLESWIAQAITAGQQSGLVAKVETASSLASAYLSLLEGAMLIARVKHSPAYLADAINVFVTGLKK
ncbi:TetR/AcrR family transcriptional regulator [Alteromonas sediminis]|uniref:TetR/AcrR family transcriptional regulator n=1 Tax=Alteromonas sediminis TaxID=2259342 RepID=A0A3N5YC21_9ALTE|nr:TetR/AcrR family transcriptional regulator [Alteromonas sediminis]RPJ66725.1 TetR/AcrR family transcriptional regulator [Alteromonas sediminis]